MDSREAWLLRADGRDPAILSRTGFKAPDPFFYLITQGSDILLVPQLEVSRAKKEADVDRVVSISQYASSDDREANMKDPEILSAFLKEHGLEEIRVRAQFPIALARGLEKRKISVKVDMDPTIEERKTKTRQEVQSVAEAQETTEEAMSLVRDIIKSAEVEDDRLWYEEQVLTSEKLRSEIKKFLIDRDCAVPEDPIAASGKESVEPHNRGSGPIKPGEPILVDIFPRRSDYFGDMTRTFWKGEPSQRFQSVYKTVNEALDRSLSCVEDGAQINQVYEAACDVIEDAGYTTLRQDPQAEYGFIHSLGHGVGLELHEDPRLADVDDTLESGMVLTVEPAIYIEGWGGIRIENMVLVTENGYENLNNMERDMETFVFDST